MLNMHAPRAALSGHFQVRGDSRGVVFCSAAKDDAATGVSEHLWFDAAKHVPELLEMVERARTCTPGACLSPSRSLKFNLRAQCQSRIRRPGQTFIASTCSQQVAPWPRSLQLQDFRPWVRRSCACALKRSCQSCLLLVARQALQYDIQLCSRSMDVSCRRGFLHLLRTLPVFCPVALSD